MNQLRQSAYLRTTFSLDVVSRYKGPCLIPRRLASTAQAPISNPTTYCRDLVRKQDYDSYLSSHFYPRAFQNSYFALKAFSIELATVQDHVSNPVIGQMRMQFWRDALKSIANDRPPRHPIALALHEASITDKVSIYHLKRIVDARDAELQNSTYLTVDSLTSHAEATSSTVLYLLLSLLSLSSTNLSHAASHLGSAQTFTTLLRALPYHVKSGRLIIPAEITAKHGVNQGEVFRKGPEAHGIEDAVFEFATLAHDHLNAARDMLLGPEGPDARVQRDAMPIFLAGVPVSNYLRRLEKANFNAFAPTLQVRDGWLPWQMWWKNYKKRF